MPERGLRPVLVFLLALAAAGAIAAIASVATRLRTVERTEREARGDPVIRLDPTLATAIRIETGGEELRLERVGSEWRLVAPAVADAGGSAVPGLLRELSGLVRRATVAPPGEPPRRLHPYGLDAPRTRIEVALEGGRSERLAFGGDTGADGATFVMPTGGEVAVISSDARAALEKRIAELRSLVPSTAGPGPAGPAPRRARSPGRGG